MKTNLLALTARVTAARAAVTKATTEKAREAATAELESATKAYALAKAKIGSKSVSILKKEEKYEEEDSAEESEDEEEEEKAEGKSDDEPKKPMAEDSASDASDSSDASSDSSDSVDDESMEEDESGDEDESMDDEDDAEDEEDADEKARAKALASAKAVLRSAKKTGNKGLVAEARAAYKATTRAVRPKALAKFSVLKQAVGQVTGKKGLRSQLGALTALAANQATIEKLSEEVSALKVYRRKERVDSMLKVARQDGKISSKERETLRADGLRLGTKWLKAHLDGRPRVRTVSEGAREGTEMAKELQEAAKSLAPKDVLAEAEKAAAEFDVENLTPEQMKIVDIWRTSSTNGAAVDPKEFVKNMNKNLARSRAAKAANSR